MANLMPSQLQFNPVFDIHGDVRVPGDKSITHRALMIGSIASGETYIHHALMGDDCLATLRVMQQLGVSIDCISPEEIRIKGVGLLGLKETSESLNLGNSGTAMRLLTGLLAGANISAKLIGDPSLSARPMQRVVEPLEMMGADIHLSEKGTAPIVLHTHPELWGIEYEMPIASAQVKSALLLAGLYASGVTTLVEPGISRDHTERMLKTFGALVHRIDDVIQILPVVELKAQEIEVPADLSSAAFFIVAAIIAAKSHVILRDVGINPTRTGIIDILRLMGATIELTNERFFGEEPVADLIIKPSSLKGIHIPKALVPSAMDEFPIIFIAAAAAQGTTILEGAQELRVKESDRITAMAEGLTRLGIDATATLDGIKITGGPMSGGTIDSYGDHRIAMAFAMASVIAKEPIIIQNCENIATSFPNFLQICQQLNFIEGE